MTRRPALLLAIQVAAVAAILGCVLALAARYPGRLDLTPERRFTLSPYTREILRRVGSEVRVTVFYASHGDAIRREMADLLGLYAEAEPRIRVRFLDLDRSPGAARRLEVSDYNTAVIEAGPRRQRLSPVTEETVTAALLAAAGTPPVVTYFVVGHGEHDPRDSEGRRGAAEVARALAAEGFVVRALEGAASVPPDAGLLVLAGPTRDLSGGEEQALADWVAGGGGALVLADPGTPASVTRLLARFGIELSNDLVVDDRGRLYGTDGLSARVAHLNQTLVPAAPEAQALLPESQTVRLVDRPGVQADYLALTPEDAWADVDRRRLADGDAVFRPGRDRRGPLPVAAFARVDAPGGREGRVVAAGDADFITNLHAGVLGNRDLLLVAAGLAGRSAASGAPRPPAPPGGTFSPLALTAGEARLILWGAALAPSALCAAIALALARRRRFA